MSKSSEVARVGSTLGQTEGTCCQMQSLPRFRRLFWGVFGDLKCLSLRFYLFTAFFFICHSVLCHEYIDPFSDWCVGYITATLFPIPLDASGVSFSATSVPCPEIPAKQGHLTCGRQLFALKLRACSDPLVNIFYSVHMFVFHREMCSFSSKCMRQNAFRS